MISHWARRKLSVLAAQRQAVDRCWCCFSAGDPSCSGVAGGVDMVWASGRVQALSQGEEVITDCPCLIVTMQGIQMGVLFSSSFQLVG